MNGANTTTSLLIITSGLSLTKTTSLILTKQSTQSKTKTPPRRHQKRPLIGSRHGAMRPLNCGICFISKMLPEAPCAVPNIANAFPNSLIALIRKTTTRSFNCWRATWLAQSNAPIHCSPNMTTQLFPIHKEIPPLTL